MDVNTAIVNCWIEVGKNITIEQMEVPVMDRSHNHAIIRIWLIHFGQKRPTRMAAVGSAVSVDADDTNVIVLQVFRALVDPGFWQQMINGPAKMIMQGYFPTDESQPVLQIWSRRWNAKGKQSTSSVADQFSMLCRINKSATSTWLKRSGSGSPCIFCSVKADGPSTDESMNTHRIIWVSRDIHEALVTLAKMPDHCGLVHRAPHSFGIRVEKARFSSAWKEIKGESEPVPSLINTKFRFLLAGAPPGLSGPQLEAWGTELSWPLRVLKNHGGGKFLIGAEKDPPSMNLVIQQHQVICQPYAERPSKQVPPIVTGKLMLPRENNDRGEDQVFLNDPWAQGRNADSSNHAAWARYRPVKTPEGTMQVDAEDTTTEIVSKQSARITEVEDQLKTLQEQISADQRANQARFNKVDHDIQAMSTTLWSTLEEALKQQSQNLVNTFDSLLRRSPRAESDRSDRSRSPVGKDK
eukprot:Skav202513  [mRNA]  locus=scaffold1359:224843:226243:- [translate_table: standard]